MIPRASAIRCVSQRLKKQLMNEFGVKEEKLTVMRRYMQKTQFPISNFQFPNKDKKCKIYISDRGKVSVGEKYQLANKSNGGNG